MQTRTQSFKESVVNIVIGYVIAFISQIVIFPIVGVEASLNQNLVIGLYFTAVSLTRSFLIRRYYNNKEKKEKYENCCYADEGLTEYYEE